MFFTETRSVASGACRGILLLGLLCADLAHAQLNPGNSRLFLRNTPDGLPFAVLGRLDPTVPGFGEAMAVGDFNCDGIEDLAIGAPDANANNVVHSGQVVIAYGSMLGLRSNDGIGLSQSSPSVPGSSEFADYFGWALAAGGLSGDDCDDLVVGTPGENFERPFPSPSFEDAGSVTFLQGRSTGMMGVGAFNLPFEDEFAFGAPDPPEANALFGSALAIANVYSSSGTLSELIIGIPDLDTRFGLVRKAGGIDVRAADDSIPLRRRLGRYFSDSCCNLANVEFDRFGSAFAVGNFDGDGLPDIAIGTPFADVDDQSAAGRINVLYGGLPPIGHGGWISFDRNSPGVPGSAESIQYFGSHLAAGDFDGDGDSDLVVGIPRVFADNAPDALMIRNGRSDGVNNFEDSRLITGEQAGLPANVGNAFGTALAIGDFNGDGFDDLATGAPRVDTSGVKDSGAVVVMYGTANGIELTRRQIWHKARTGIPGDLEVDEEFGAGLAAGDFNDDRVDDLAIAIPQQILGSTPRGGVLVIYGRRAAVTDRIFANGFEPDTSS